MRRLHLVDVATEFPRVYRARFLDGRSVVSAPMDWSAIFAEAPDIIFSDQKSEFTSGAAADYCSARGIQHLFSPAYGPASSGLVDGATGS